MKKLFLFLFIASLLPDSGFCQSITCSKKSGVFKTYLDFSMNKFSDSICIDYSKNKLLNGIAWNIILKSDTTKIIYKPGDIYGYYDDGIKYRYYEEKGVFTPYGYFEILDTKGLIIYFQRKHSKYGSYENYYYSSQDSGKIKSLSNSNLESDFQNPDFVNEIKSLKNLVAKLNENYQLNIIYDKYYSAK